MTDKLPRIYFYIPQKHWPSTIPKSADSNWKGFGIGIYAWTLQTYLRLKADGFPCTLVSELPSEGIVLAHRNSLRVHKSNFQPTPKLLLVCLKAELKPYPGAQLHVVQNPLETKTFRNSYYLPHWPQPALIPRDTARGDRFENIAFFGHKVNLAPELLHPYWQQKLERLHLRWYPIINRNRWDSDREIDDRWHNYSEIDAVIAVRSLNQQQLYLSKNYLSKPATKLYNAWLAGVPAILGSESAYQTEHRNELDYLEVSSLEDILSALQKLRDHRALRLAMIKNGQVRAQAICPSQITVLWRNFLENVAIPAYHCWCSQSRWSQQVFLGSNYLAFNWLRMQDKVHHALATPLDNSSQKRLPSEIPG
ncbi:hypothetical protein [Lyngbya aestuarii]|uniref:hypothetical protein n=1 Tax=Lyngbya aestuarii TaxID=118322 RepID=UPI00403D6551